MDRYQMIDETARLYTTTRDEITRCNLLDILYNELQDIAGASEPYADSACADIAEGII